jgi:hypothetical protein
MELGSIIIVLFINVTHQSHMSVFKQDHVIILVVLGLSNHVERVVVMFKTILTGLISL